MKLLLMDTTPKKVLLLSAATVIAVGATSYYLYTRAARSTPKSGSGTSVPKPSSAKPRAEPDRSSQKNIERFSTSSLTEPVNVRNTRAPSEATTISNESLVAADISAVEYFQNVAAEAAASASSGLSPSPNAARSLSSLPSEVEGLGVATSTRGDVSSTSSYEEPSFTHSQSFSMLGSSLGAESHAEGGETQGQAGGETRHSGYSVEKDFVVKDENDIIIVSQDTAQDSSSREDVFLEAQTGETQAPPSPRAPSSPLAPPPPQSPPFEGGSPGLSRVPHIYPEELTERGAGEKTGEEEEMGEGAEETKKTGGGRKGMQEVGGGEEEE